MRQLSDDVLFDKRLVERHIRQGLITREQYEKHLEGSPDLGEDLAGIDLDALESEILEGTKRSLGSTPEPTPG